MTNTMPVTTILQKSIERLLPRYQGRVFFSAEEMFDELVQCFAAPEPGKQSELTRRQQRSALKLELRTRTIATLPRHTREVLIKAQDNWPNCQFEQVEWHARVPSLGKITKSGLRLTVKALSGVETIWFEDVEAVTPVTDFSEERIRAHL